MDHRKCKGQMDSRHDQGKEEHRQYLRIDAPPDIRFRHAYLLHDLKPGLILIAFRDLLIINDQHRGKNKHHAQQDSQEEQASIQAVERRPLFCRAPAVCQKRRRFFRAV